MSGDSENVQFDYSKDILNPHDILVVARKASNDPQARVLNYSLAPYSEEPLGYISTYQQLKIEIQRSDISCPDNLSLFVKAIAAEHDVEDAPQKHLFDKEATFYKTLAIELSKVSPDEKWCPTCYLIKDNVIVMEDLRSQGYELLDLKKFNDYKVLKMMLTALARFHACSILLEAHWHRNSKSPVGISEKHPDICEELVFNPSSKVHDWLVHGINLTIVMGDHLGYNTSKLRDAFQKLYELTKPSKVHRNALCHGDLWLNNMMFTGAGKCVLIDFQVIRYAPLVFDILQLLHLNASSAFREKHERDLVELYHSVLRETASKSELAKLADVPTLEAILLGLRDLRLLGPAMACLYFPTVLIDASLLSEGEQESKNENVNLVFKDKTAAALQCIEKDASFKEKIDDAINELVKISETL